MKAIIIAVLLAFVCSVEVAPVEEQPLEWNPQGLLQCLTEAAPMAKDVIELINLLKAKDYNAAFKKAMALLPKGIQVVQKCVKYIVGSAVNLTVNWPALGKCIVHACSGAGMVASLAAAVSAQQWWLVAILVPQIVANIGGTPKNCQRFW